jgi:hypothetical protein
MTAAAAAPATATKPRFIVKPSDDGPKNRIHDVLDTHEPSAMRRCVDSFGGGEDGGYALAHAEAARRNRAHEAAVGDAGQPQPEPVHIRLSPAELPPSPPSPPSATASAAPAVVVAAPAAKRAVTRDPGARGRLVGIVRTRGAAGIPRVELLNIAEATLPTRAANPRGSFAAQISQLLAAGVLRADRGVLYLGEGR